MGKIPASRRQIEQAERRKSILAAAEEIFGSVGYHDASVTEIAQRSGFAAGTIYLYFQDKADLYGTLIAEKMADLIDRIEEALRSSDSPSECLREAVQVQFAFHDVNRRFFEIFLQQHQVQSSPLHRDRWEEMEGLKRRNLSLFQDCVVRGQAAGELREGDARLYAVALLGIVLQITRQWFREGRRGRLLDLAAFAVDCFLNGAGGKAETRRRGDRPEGRQGPVLGSGKEVRRR